MATVKITDLPYITSLQPNTANTVIVGVDVPSDDTGQITLTTLAAGLYSNNRLVVGNYSTVYPNAITTFANTSNNYVQSIIENTDDDGTSDWVAQANVSTDTAYYIDLGFTGNNYNNLNPYNSLGTSVHPLDGYLYVQGLDGNKGGNLVIGTTSTNTLINFIVGGINLENVAAYMTPSGIYSPSIDSLVAANVATLRGEVTSNVSTINGSITANAASANSVIDSRITANIATANLFTQAAFDKANNALANTTGTFAGSLTITNNLITNGVITLANSGFSATQAAMTISASNTGVTQTPGGDGYMIHVTGKHNVPARVVSDSFGANGQLVFPIFGGRAARGNVTNPSAVQTNDILTRLAGTGYGATSYQTGGLARIDIVATENHTDSARGTAIKFYNVPNGSNVVGEIATFNANTADFLGSVNPQKGFIYTPRILAGAQTAITINFATDSMIRAEFNSTLTISLSNYTYGKVVEVWVTNTAGNGQTINLGTLSNNVTTGSSTLSVAAGRSAKLQYFSIDGDQANTFLAVTYA